MICYILDKINFSFMFYNLMINKTDYLRKLSKFIFNQKN